MQKITTKKTKAKMIKKINNSSKIQNFPESQARKKKGSKKIATTIPQKNKNFAIAKKLNKSCKKQKSQKFTPHAKKFIQQF